MIFQNNIRRTLANDAEKLQKTIPGRYVARDNYHITLARKAGIETEPLKNWLEKNDAFHVNEITLFQSTRIDGKSSYLSIEKAHFKD